MAILGFIDNIREKIELYKLEQRYTRRSKRTTFVSTAEYINGEYVYSGSSLTLKSSNGSSNGWMDKREPSVRVKQIVKRHSTIF